MRKVGIVALIAISMNFSTISAQADQLLTGRGIAKSIRVEDGVFKAVGTWKPTRTLTSIICARSSATSGICIRTDVDGDMLIMDDYEVTSWNSRGLRARLISPLSTESIDVDFETKSVTRTISPNGKTAFVETLGD
jgi:hypothetical protein